MKASEMAEIIAKHQPDEIHSHHANERFCTGCCTFDSVGANLGKGFRVFPWSEFPLHQAEMIKKAQRERKSG